MRANADRPHARTAAAMGNAEGLVQVEVADIAADLAGLRKPDHGIEVRPVDIDLSAMVMGDFANLAHGVLEHAMGGRIGDHAGGKICAVLLGLGPEIGNVDIAFFIGLDDDDFPADHHGGCRVGAMGRGWDQADIAVLIAIGKVIGADGQAGLHIRPGRRNWAASTWRHSR